MSTNTNITHTLHQVGIGTTSPDATLHVKASGNVGLLESTTDTAYLRLSTSEGTDKRVEFANRIGGHAAIWVSGPGDALNVLSGSGNVGIGTTTPTQKLEVNGAVKANGLVFDKNVSEHIEVDGAMYRHDDGTGGQVFLTVDDTLFIRDLASDGSHNIKFHFDTNHGFLGIGKKDPVEALHVIASGTVGLFESTTNNAFLKLSTSEGTDKRVEFANRPGGNAAIWVSGSGDALNVLSGSGNVGIGTTTPTQKLEVNGAVKANGLVFDKNVSKHIEVDGAMYRHDGGTGGQIFLTVDDTLFIRDLASDGSHNIKFHFDTNHGCLGIGKKSPTEALDVNGKVKCTALVETSDGKFKKEVSPITNALEKVTGLRGVNYLWKDTQQENGLQMGLIAQEVESILPEVVSTDSNGDKSIAYSKLTAILIEAVKELSNKLNQQQPTATA